MSEWWTYTLSDFLLFSPQTYYRLLELYNTDVWPMQILSLALGIVILGLSRRNPPWYGKMTATILAFSWLWVAWAYHYQRYATINWAATYYAAGFVIEAGLFIWIGIIRGRLLFQPVSTTFKYVGFSIFLFALVGLPVVNLITGREWLQLEIFGIAPDPTVIATLGILLLAAQRGNRILLVIPLLWCMISGATLWTMKSPDAFIVLLIGFLVVLLMVWRVVWYSGR